MKKCAIITDTHWGVRNNSLIFLELMSHYWKTEFFPYLVENGIKTIIHGGDLVENRSAANYRMLRYLKESFSDLLVVHGITMHIIPGNHDIFYRHDVEINAPQELFNDHPNVIVHTKPEDVQIEGTSFLLVPWISPKNEAACFEAIAASKSDYCLGHFEIEGAKMFRSSVSEHGLPADKFKHFKKVFSGHFHHPNVLSNIHYLGATFHTTWQCYGDRRGFNVLDTSTGEHTLIENPLCLFERIYYDDVDGFDAPDLEVLQRELSGRIVELVVTNKTDQAAFKRFRDDLDQVDVVDLTVVDRYLLKNTEQPVDVNSIDSSTSPVDVVVNFMLDSSKCAEVDIRAELNSAYEAAVDLMVEGE
jgi:DNA repair exonuclease SbcCD nuclease subunit